MFLESYTINKANKTEKVKTPSVKIQVFSVFVYKHKRGLHIGMGHQSRNEATTGERYFEDKYILFMWNRNQKVKVCWREVERHKKEIPRMVKKKKFCLEDPY